jgi:hypothetical protein
MINSFKDRFTKRTRRFIYFLKHPAFYTLVVKDMVTAFELADGLVHQERIKTYTALFLLEMILQFNFRCHLDCLCVLQEDRSYFPGLLLFRHFYDPLEMVVMMVMEVLVCVKHEDLKKSILGQVKVFLRQSSV